MDGAAQKAGEARVQAKLIDPLIRLGLAKPSTLTVAQFSDMLGGLCQYLAYMTTEDLSELVEKVSANPGGKDRDRFPIANKILPWARDIAEPDHGPSPLMLKVFAHRDGRAALDKGWAPELLAHIRAARRWPGAYVLSQIKDGASAAVRRLEDVEMRLSRGEEVPKNDADWRNKRRAALRRCEDIADAARVAA